MQARWLFAVFVSSVAVTSCNDGASAEATKICEEAAQRYITCTEETLGREAADMVRSKQGGVEACAKDERTVAFYKDKCLPTPDCDAFMSCVMDLAMQAP